ncbi:GNAT family N-acetyltransferase [Nitratireductor kimnyeongensis]|uniref:GNAT family N-acetyltransferase n=1 Tax=Nitratireductor kimnyeongensis TaxID=430679 RepID=A0ABW0TBV7_9HYPH|nr:GNAT family N-acetyltransferase [Nitratireductor kimnyeongensis]QZZ37137.1 GNAT family N-acetyltransferase [Nitratireductor kimnyeongensis]
MEARAAELFAAYGYARLAATPALAQDAFNAIASRNRTFVAAHEDDGAIGFAICGQIGSFLHLKELSVAPEHGRRGLGSALLDAVIAESVARKLDGVSLSTFRSVPFNAPFYKRHGFVDEPFGIADETLKKRFLAEIPPGIVADARLLMVRRNKTT